MKITFLGLSSFLIENKYGHRILVDPYDDSPQWNFGLTFPCKIGNKRLASELVLLSHMDADHASFRPEVSTEPLNKKTWNANEYNVKFPNLRLRGVLVKEWSGYPNIAWSYNIDGCRLMHLADNARMLTQDQLREAGLIDILFISPSKVSGDINQTLATIEKIKPKFVVWAHHIPVKPMGMTDENKIRAYFKKTILLQKKNRHSTLGIVEVFTGFFVNIFKMNNMFNKVILVDSPTYEVPKKKKTGEPVILFFRKCAGN